MKKFNAKKFLAGLSSVTMIASAMPIANIAVQAAEETSVMYGDANLDGKVTLADAVAILQNVANKEKYPLDENAKNNSDVYNRGDGITAMDALSIQKYDSGAVKELPESWQGGQPTETTVPQETTTTSDETPVADIVYIHLNGTSISVESDSNGYTTVEGSKVTINHSGSYYIDGTLDDGQININVADETTDTETVKLYLNGVTIAGKSAPAILVTNANNTSINLVDGTVNTITDSDTAYLGADGLASGEAVIEAKDDLTIKGGTGVLNVTANTQDGIACNNDIKINGGVINVTTLNATDNTDGIKGKTSVTIKDGTVNVEAEGDGIKASSTTKGGNVVIQGGTVNVKAGNDAIQSATTIDISGGVVVAGGDRGLTSATGTNITGGTVIATATDNQTDSALLSGTTQGTMLLNCVADSTSKDGTWKKANTITVGSVSQTFTKKYSYVLISDSSITAGGSYSLTNAGTGATVTYNNDEKDTFAQSDLITTYENVNPAGKDGSSSGTTVTTGNTITLSGTSILSDAPTDSVTVSGNVATITKEGVYTITGDASDVQIVVDVDSTAYPNSVVELDLVNANISNSTTAPIYVKSVGDEVQIVAKAGTTNTVSDGTSHTETYTDSDGNVNTVEGAIFARDDIKFKGTGSLTVNGNETDAIVCKNDIKIYNGNITVNAVDDGIRGKDSVTIGNDSKSDGSAVDYSTLNLTVKTQGGDGIKATATDIATDTKTYGLVTINGGTVNINSYADGIQAEQEFIMNGGDVTIYTYQGSNFTGTGSSSSSGTTTDPWSSGRPGQGRQSGMGQDGNSNKTDISAKGIKSVGLYDTAGTTWQSMGNLTINGGTLNINSSDDSIHCGGDMYLLGGEMTLATADDGAHSDHKLTIGQGSSTTYDDVKILVTKGYEGIEAQQIVQNSGSAIINVTDDGFNAGGGSDGSGNTAPGGSPFDQGSMGTSGNYSLTINGGFAIVNVASGDHDGFDSNGTITMTGGIAVTNGNEPFDSDGSISFTGGVWIENSSSGGSYMDTQPSYTVNGGSVSQGERISLVDSNGNVIVSFKAGKSVSTLRAGGNVSGASFQTGGTLSGSTYFIDGQECAYGGTLSGGTSSSGSGSSGSNPWGQF